MPMIYQVGFDIWLVSSNVTREILLSMEVFIGIKNGKKKTHQTEKTWKNTSKLLSNSPYVFVGKKHINWGSFQLAILDSWCRTPKCGTSAPAVAKLVHV